MGLLFFFHPGTSPPPPSIFLFLLYIYIFNKRIYFLAVTHRLCCIKPPLHGEAAKCRGKADTLLQIFHVFAELAALRLGFSNSSYFPCNLSFHSPPPPLSSSSPPQPISCRSEILMKLSNYYIFHPGGRGNDKQNPKQKQ